MYSRTVRTFSSKVAGNFILAGSFMICYAIISGLVPSDAVLPIVDVPIILFRGGSAFLIMFYTIRALSVFSLEQNRIINDKLLRFSQSEKLTSMGILAAGIAHEINNPLANVSLNLELLKDMVEPTERISKKMDAIERNVSRASRIAKELLHFSREKETDLVDTDINQVLQSTKNLLKNQVLHSIISLQLGSIPLIKGIPWKLEEVFINILMNSLDACEEQDHVEVETLRDGAVIMVVITDTGHGIREDSIHQVFDPFFTTKEIGKGTGLGLSVCYNIIKQHNGEISLMSSDLGGTIVTITFPVPKDDV